MEMDEDQRLLTRLATMMEGVKTDIHEMREEMRRYNEEKVSRNEWLQRNEYVDKRFIGFGQEISEMKQDQAARRTPWTAAAGAVTGIGALVVSGILAVVTFTGS